MKRSTVLLVILGLLAVTAGWWMFVIGPRNDAISMAEDQLFTAEQQANQLRVRIQQLNDIKDQEISYLFAIGEMETSIPTEPEFDTFLEDLTFLAERVGVDIIALSATPPALSGAEEAAALFEIDLNLSLEGQFFEVLGFLFGLEEMERLIRVDTLALNPIVVAEEVTTTTTTAAPDDSSTTSTSTSSTTTTTIDVRSRPEPGLLSINLTASLFTRTPIAVPAIIIPADGEAPADGDQAPEEGQ